MSAAAFAAGLGRASLEAAALALAVALVTRFVTRMPAAARGALWWLVSLRALLACLGLPGVPLPLLPAVSAPGAAGSAMAGAATPPPLETVVLPLAPPASADPATFAWIGLALLWGAGAAALARRQIRDARRVLRLWRAGVPLESVDARHWLGAWLGGPRAARVELRASAAIDAPLLIGWGAPRILVPAGFPAADRARARMALAHEAAHLLRRDLWWGWVPALAECVFWFHPLVRWSAAEYAQAREEACDAKAVDLTGAEPGGFGEMLVGFGVDRARFGHAAASCGSRHVRQLTRRLHMLSMLKSMTRTQRAAATALVVLLGLAAVVPLRVVAADRDAAAQDARPDAGEPAAAGEALRTAFERETGAAAPAGLAHPHDPDDSRDDDHARAHGDTHGDTRGDAKDSGYAYGWSDDEGESFSYGLLEDGTQTLSGSFGDGDWSRIGRIRDAHPGRIFWFRLDGRHYVVEDRATWNRVHKLLEPQRALGRRQGELGAQQGELGAEQADLGGRQAGLGAEQARLSAEMARLTMALSFGDADRAERAALRRQIDDLSDRINDLGERQRALGEQQQALGERQRALGERQQDLGERQRAEAEKSRGAVRRIAEQCVRDGRAQRWDG